MATPRALPVIAAVDERLGVRPDVMVSCPVDDHDGIDGGIEEGSSKSVMARHQ
jgi:hypothetical protein